MLKYVKGSAEILSSNFNKVEDQNGENTIPVAFMFYKISCTGDNFNGEYNYVVGEAILCSSLKFGDLTPEEVEANVNRLNRFVFAVGDDPGERFGADSAQDFSDDTTQLILDCMNNCETLKA